jgi:hypothetical protein
VTHEDTAPTTGSVSIGGSMHGGAVSTGRGGSAEVRAPAEPEPRRARVHEEALPSRPATPRSTTAAGATPGSVTIGGDARGVAISTGDHGTARYEATSTSVGDEQYQDLLEQVRLLRQQLPLFTGAKGVVEVEAELAEAEEEITLTGVVTPGLLRRLWERLEQASTALGGLSSALALAEAVRKLTG